MIVPIPNGSFEGGGSWLFTGTAGITSSPSSVPGVVQTAHDGSSFGYMNVMQTSTASPGSMTVDVDVGVPQAGYYHLDGWYCANHYPVGVFGDGADYFSVYLDGSLWLDAVNAYAGGYRHWLALTSEDRLLRAGTHTLLFVGVNQPLADYSGTPWDGWLSLMLFDGLQLVGEPYRPNVRMVYDDSSGALVRLVRRGERSMRMVRHD